MYIVSVHCTEVLVNVAVSDAEPEGMVTLHVVWLFEHEKEPDHELNVYPEPAVAVRVSNCPETYSPEEHPDDSGVFAESVPVPEVERVSW